MTKRKPKPSARLELRIWTDSARHKLPDDLAQAFAPHAEHVQRLLEQDYTSGEIVDDQFRGWWTIERD